MMGVDVISIMPVSNYAEQIEKCYDFKIMVMNFKVSVKRIF